MTDAIAKLVETVKASSVKVIVTTSRLTIPSSTPASFFIYYYDPVSNATQPSPQFLSSDTAPGGSGLVLSPQSAADSFSLDTQGRLIDLSDDNQFIARNTDDLYPFELLRTKAATKNVPTCSACAGKLQCDYPGTSDNTFAMCYGYLALGPKSIFGKDSDNNGDVDCTPIDLLFV